MFPYFYILNIKKSLNFYKGFKFYRNNYNKESILNLKFKEVNLVSFFNQWTYTIFRSSHVDNTFIIIRF